MILRLLKLSDINLSNEQMGRLVININKYRMAKI